MGLFGRVVDKSGDVAGSTIRGAGRVGNRVADIAAGGVRRLPGVLNRVGDYAAGAVRRVPEIPGLFVNTSRAAANWRALGVGGTANAFAAEMLSPFGIAKTAEGGFTSFTSKHAVGGKWMGYLGLLGIGVAAAEGYKSGGLGGAIGGGLKEGIQFGLFNVATKALSTTFAGSFIGAAFWPLAVTGGLAYGGAKLAQGFAQRGRAYAHTEFASNYQSIYSSNAATMRQRAMNEIAASHTNARSILGNEAQMYHL